MLIQYVDDNGLPFYYETTSKHFSRTPSQNQFVPAKTPLQIFQQVPIAIFDESKQQKMIWYRVQLNNGDEFYFDPKENESHWNLPETCKEFNPETNKNTTTTKQETEIDDDEFEILEDTNYPSEELEEDEFEVMDMETGEIVELENEHEESTQIEKQKIPEIAPPSKIVDLVSGKIISKEGSVNAFDSTSEQNHQQHTTMKETSKQTSEEKQQIVEEEEPLEDIEYSNLSQDEKVRLFKQLLIDKNIPSHAKWDSSVLKLRPDKRYRVIDNIQQKRAIFDHFIRNRDLEIQKENNLKKKESIERYKHMLNELFTTSTTASLNFKQFSELYGSEKWFIDLRDSKQKELLFQQLQKQYSESTKKQQTQSKQISTETNSTNSSFKPTTKKEMIEQFKSLLTECILQYDASIKYEHVKEQLGSDPRFDEQQRMIKDSEKKILFQQHLQKLKQQQK